MTGFALSVLRLLQGRVRERGILYRSSAGRRGAGALATNKPDAGGKGQGS
jgi:hypothetical protein